MSGGAVQFGQGLLREGGAFGLAVGSLLARSDRADALIGSQGCRLAKPFGLIEIAILGRDYEHSLCR